MLLPARPKNDARRVSDSLHEASMSAKALFAEALSLLTVYLLRRLSNSALPCGLLIPDHFCNQGFTLTEHVPLLYVLRSSGLPEMISVISDSLGSSPQRFCQSSSMPVPSL